MEREYTNEQIARLRGRKGNLYLGLILGGLPLGLCTLVALASAPTVALFLGVMTGAIVWGAISSINKMTRSIDYYENILAQDAWQRQELQRQQAEDRSQAEVRRVTEHRSQAEAWRPYEQQEFEKRVPEPRQETNEERVRRLYREFDDWYRQHKDDGS